MLVERHYRPMQMQDLDAIMQIEERVYPFPWTRGNFSDSIQSGYTTQVVERQGEIIAYALTMMVLDEAHLLNVSVDASFQGQGLGRELLSHMIGLARKQGASNMFLEVRASNHVAISLYQSIGFCEVSIRKAYYRDKEGREDAVLMALVI